MCHKTFPVSSFCGSHVKPCYLWGLSKHYHLYLDTKLGHEKCSIQNIPCACVKCTNILENTWAPGVYHVQQPRYQPIFEFTYLPALVRLKNCNIIQFKNKTTSSDKFYYIHKVVLDGINDNMA